VGKKRRGFTVGEKGGEKPLKKYLGEKAPYVGALAFSAFI